MKIIMMTILLGAGGLVQGVTGFGMAIVVMPFLVLLLPVKTASLVFLLAAYINVAQLFYSLRRHVRLKCVVPVVVGSIAGSSVGIYTLVTLQTEFLKSILGYCLIAFALYFAFAADRVRIRPTIFNGLLTGLFSGILGGLFNISGPPKVAYFYSATTSKEEYMANNQTVNIITMTYSICLHLLMGNINMEILKLSGTGVLAVLLGTYVGFRIFMVIRKKALNVAMTVLMAVMGVLMIVK